MPTRKSRYEDKRPKPKSMTSQSGLSGRTRNQGKDVKIRKSTPSTKRGLAALRKATGT